MNTTDLKGALATLREAERILIITHQGPDGDAVGSALGAVYLLEALGKTNIVCACQDPVPRIYRWVPGWERMIRGDAIAGTFDLVLVTDVARLDRTGTAGAKLAPDQKILVLDHHLEERPCGTLNFIDPTYASASEIILDLFELAGLQPSTDAATCIYVGLSTDTGGFRYSNTDVRAHRHAATLVGLGVDVSGIATRVFDSMSIAKSKLLRVALVRMEYEDAFAHTYVTHSDIETVKGSAEDVEGMVNYARYLEGVEVGAFFRGVDANQTKVSLRSSKTFNSAQLLKAFGGGGHAAAAGATLAMPMIEARTTICAAIRARLKELQEHSS